MKTVAQWAEQLPELIRIEFLYEAKRQIELDKNAILLHYAIYFIDWVGLGYDFWEGVYYNSYELETSADYIDETIPYTKEEVDAMILEFSDPNDDVCQVMLANVGKTKEVKLKVGDVLVAKDEYIMNFSGKPALVIGKAYTINGDSSFEISLKTEDCEQHFFSLKEDSDDYFGKFFYLPNEIEVIDVHVENEALKAKIQTQGDLIIKQQKGLNEVKALLMQYRADNGKNGYEIEQLKKEIFDLENNNHELLEKTKPETNHKPSLSQRFLNWILS